ncbi:MAG: hypothetical protein H6656_15545 [Ardenticatenaceae bacterium]|nr:hypothetical protein [Ardenticatenaceae bacterium]
MALLLFLLLSLITSILVIFAAILSSRLSRHENWTESYDNAEGSGNQSQPLRAQMSSN